MPNFPLRIKSSSSCEEKKEKKNWFVGMCLSFDFICARDLVRNLRFLCILDVGFDPGSKPLSLHQSSKIDGFLRPSSDLTGSGKPI